MPHTTPQPSQEATSIKPSSSGRVAVYCGHMFNAGSEAEAVLRARLDETLERLDIRVGYGPLACGADIVIAEALLARGAELHVVLPFAEDDFIAESVLCGGEAWLSRYKACRERATSFNLATGSAYVGDDNQFAYNTLFAMGLSSLAASERGSEAVQIAVLNDNLASLSATGLAGTKADMRLWQRLGRESVVIPAGPVPRDLTFPDRPAASEGTRREIRSILFADYKGFSRIGERELPIFMHGVMGAIAAVLQDFGDHVMFRNTWGDAIYAVIDEPVIAAKLAMALQERLEQLPEELDNPQAGMRIGLHYGPIWVGTDRITGNRLWYGQEVNLTARIEPITPVGGVYCTQSFAAALLMTENHPFRFTSVGRQPLPKGFGDFTLYRME